MRGPKCKGRRGRQQGAAATESSSPPSPQRYTVTSMSVTDDGFSLTGGRYPPFLAEVKRRQDGGLPQDEITIWHRSSSSYTLGVPRINNEGDLEVLDVDNGHVLGTVRTLDGRLYFFLS